MRGQSLTIDLGQSYAGFTLEAWMKKTANSLTYRSFTIVDDRYLFLEKNKTNDYYSIEDNTLIEAVKGKWIYDVRAIPDGATSPDDEGIVASGVIYFKDNVTGGAGQELVYTDRPYANEFINLNDTPLNYVGQSGRVLRVNSAEDGIIFDDIVEDKNFLFTQTSPTSVWTVAHNQNKYPSVSIFDSANNPIMGQVENIDLNNLTITFNAAISGSAFIN